MKTPYGTWDNGNFTTNDGRVIADDPNGWSPAVAADGPGLGDMLKKLFGGFGAALSGAGVPMPPERPVQASFVPEFTAPAAIGPGAVPTMARPASPQAPMTIGGGLGGMPTFAMPGFSGVTPAPTYADPNNLDSAKRAIAALFRRRA